MDGLLLQLLAGLSGASVLFLTAAGLTVIFGVTRIVNFAHGSLAMLGAYVGWSVLTRLPREPWAFGGGVVLTVLAVAAIGAVLEVTVLRRVYRAPELFQLLATFGVVLIVADLTQAVWGPADLPLPRPRWLRATVEVLGGRTPVYDLVLIAAGPVVLGALVLVLRHTRWGTLVRAATLDREMVGALGVDERWLFTSVFALGAGLAGLGGVLSLPSGSAHLGIDLSVVVDAFVVVVLGGLGSLGGAYLASLLLAVGQSLGVLYLPQSTLVLGFVILLAVLAVRPNGLAGRPQAPARPAQAPAVVRPAPRAVVVAGAAVLLLFASLPLWAGSFALSVAMEAAVAVLFAASLHFIMGPGGMPSFGHAAWFGIGAYAAALLAHPPWLGGTAPVWLALPAAFVASGVAAGLFGLFVARLSGVYLAMLTLAFAQIVWGVAFAWVSVTGGDNGLLGLSAGLGPAGLYYLTLVLCVGGTLLLRRVLGAPFGYALRAGRDDAARAGAIGLPVDRLRQAAFALSGASAGLAGAVFTYGKGAVFPTYVTVNRSVDALLTVLLGGVDTLSGPVVGALAYTGLVDVLLRVTEWWRLVLGCAILLLVVLLPDGIAGTVSARMAHIRMARGRMEPDAGG